MVFKSFHNLIRFLDLIIAIVICDKNVMANNFNDSHHHHHNHNVNDTIINENDDNQLEPYVTCEYHTPMPIISEVTNINDLAISSNYHFWINIFPIIMAIIGVLFAFTLLAHFMINSLPMEDQQNHRNTINPDNRSSTLNSVTTTTTTTTNNCQKSSSSSSSSDNSYPPLSSQTLSSTISSSIIMK